MAKNKSNMPESPELESQAGEDTELVRLKVENDRLRRQLAATAGPGRPDVPENAVFISADDPYFDGVRRFYQREALKQKFERRPTKDEYLAAAGGDEEKAFALFQQNQEQAQVAGQIGLVLAPGDPLTVPTLENLRRRCESMQRRDEITEQIAKLKG